MKRTLQKVTFGARLLCIGLMSLCMWITTTNAQNIANYTFSSISTGSLDAMTGATSMASSGGIVAGYNDDNASGVLAMGFNFPFMGNYYTHFSANSNGQMQLHLNSSATAIGSNVSTTSGLAILAPMTGDNSTITAMTYLLTGTAPNRIFKLQFPGFAIPYSSSNPNGDMQVWLYENGTIEYVYGTMYAASAQTRSTFISSSNTNTTVQTVTIGIPPTSANTATLVSNSFSTGNISGLYSATQGNRRVLTFTPSIGTPAAATSLSFSNVIGSAMKLTWADNATNESFYKIQFAKTGLTGYSTAAILPANSTTYSASGLVPFTSYDWKVSACTEVDTSGALIGTQLTGAPSAFTTTATGGVWSATTTWVGGVIPTAYDTAIVATGSTLTVDVAATIARLQLNTGSTVFLNNTLVDSNDLVIASGATFNGFFGTTGRQLTVRGNITNNGTFNMAMPGGILLLNGITPQTIGGTGTLGIIPTLTVNNLTGAVINGNVTIGAALNLTNGVVSGTGTITIGNALFSPTFAMVSTGGTISSTTVSGLNGIFPGNATFTYNAPTPIASITTGNELNISAAGIMNVTFNAIAGGNYTIGTNISVNNLTVSDTVTTANTVTANGIATFNTTSYVDGSGTFTLGANGTIVTPNLLGITASGNGSVRTTTRNFSATGNYTYNGAAGQVTGDGLPATLTGGTVTFSTTSGTLLSQSTVFNNITLTTNFLLGTNSATVNGIANIGTLAITGAGTFTAGATSRLLLNSTAAAGVLQNAAGLGNIQCTGGRTYTTGLDIVIGGSAVATGDNFPTIGIDSLVLNQTTVVVLTAATSTNTLYITNTGRMTTTAINALTVLGTAATNVARISTGYIDGPLTRTLGVGAVGNFSFPLGVGAVGNLGLEIINPVVTGSSVTLTAIARSLATGGTAGTGLTALTNTRYWAIAPVAGGGILSSVGNIRLFESTQTTLGATSKKIGFTTVTPTNAFNTIGGQLDSLNINILSSLAIPAFGVTDSTFLVLGNGTASGVFTGGTLTVGPTGTYKSLTAAIAAINERTSLSAPVILEFQTTYTSTVEAYPIVFRATLPTTQTNSITIRPAAAVSSAISFAGAIFTSTSLFDFNGGKNIIIDGRPGGTGTNRYLSFTQQNIGAFPTFRFINDAQNDTLRYVTVAGQNTSTTSGLIVIGTTNATGGNNNIGINNCAINGLSNTANCIYGSGTATPADNKNVNISNNNIFDFFVNGSSPTGIIAGAASSAWTISSNNFYQTAIRNSYSNPIMNAATSFRALQLNNNASNASFVVTNNRVGGNISGIAGSVFILGDSISNLAHLFRPFDFSNAGSTSIATSVQGNVISDITLYTNGTDQFTGIGALQTGLYSIGDVTPNVVGSTTTNGSITIYHRGTGAATARGFQLTATGGGTMQNNIVSGISLVVQGAQAAGGSINFLGMNAGATFLQPVTITGNTIGSTTLANSIQGLSTSLGATGIQGLNIATATGAAITVSNNTVSNLSILNQAFSSVNAIKGIYVTGTSSVSTTVTGNSIKNLRNDAPNSTLGDNSAINGIVNSSSGAGSQFITNNAINSLRSTYNGPVTNSVMGIYYNSSNTGGTSRVDRNVIHSLETGSTNNFALQTGVNIGTSSTTLQLLNNFVRLGVNVDGTTNNANVTLYGILKQNTSNTSIIYNTVYIGGSPATTDTTSLTAAFYKFNSAAIDTVMNNIFVNARTNASGTGEHYAAYINNATGLRSDANIYRANGTGGIVWRNGFSRLTTIQSWRAAVKPYDQRSAVGNPSFNAGITNAAATINFTLAAATPAATAAIPLSYITVDQGGNTRSATPAIGSYDIGLSALTATTDIYNPVITLTPLGNRASANTTVNAVVVTDIGSGVPTSGATAPKLWYRNATTSSVWASVAPTSFTGTGNNVTFVYNFNWTLIGGAPAVNARIKYYFVAADAATTPNIWYSNYTAIDPIHSAVGTQTTAPATADSFLIVNPLATTINIPVDYPSLSGVGGLFNAINNAALAANTTVNITADVNETGVNELKNDGLSGFKLTIQPDATLRTLWGNSTTSMLRFNGVANVVIDGGASRNLKIVDSIGLVPSSTVGSAVQFYNGCTNDTLVNCIIEGNSSNGAIGTVLLGAGNNSNIVIANNIIKAVAQDSSNRPSNAIYSASAGNASIIIGGVTARPGGNFINDFSSIGINIASSGDNMTIGSSTVSTNGNYINSRVAGGAITYINVGVGNNHLIGYNKIYQPSGNYSGNITGILLPGSGNGIVVTRNSIGGGAADRSGLSMTSTGGYFRGIDITAGTVTASSVDSNYISNITTTGSVGVFAIYLNSGNVNITKNIIGGKFNPQDTIQNGYDNGLIFVAGGNIVLVQDNIMGNMTYYKAAGDRTAGITVSGTPPSLTIRNNTIRDFNSNSTGTTTSQYRVVGMIFTGAVPNMLVENNTIYNINNTNTTSGSYVPTGINLNGAVINSTFRKNRIYNIGTAGTGTSTSAANAYGIHISSGSAFGNLFINNQISVGANTVGETVVQAIRDEITSGTNTYTNNSIFVNGTITAGANHSFGIFRSAAGTVNLVNNLIYNKRATLGTGKGFAVGSTNAVTNANLNYNTFIVADTGAIAQLAAVNQGWAALGTLYTTTYNTNWAEKTSVVPADSLFIDTAASNLGIVTANSQAWYVNGKGIRVIGQTGDFNNLSGVRSGALTTGSVDIGSVEFTPTSTPPSAYADKAPNLNDSVQFFFASRMIAKTVFGATGSAPSAVDMKYYSGVTPANTGTKTRMNAYWNFTQTGGSGFSYGLTLMQDSSVLGTVAAPGNLGIARYSGTGVVWTNYPATVSNNTTGFMSAPTVSVVGIFTGTDLTSNPLPVKLLSLTASNKEGDVLVSWTTASEENNKGFEVERSIDGQSFEQIGFVKGAGNSYHTLSYNLTDAKAFDATQNNVLYYRLKQVDFSGEYTYSEVVAVRNDVVTENGISAYPNPFADNYTVSFTTQAEGRATIQMMDIQGKLVAEQTTAIGKGTNVIGMDKVSGLERGIYFVKVTVNGESQILKMIKQ